MSYNLTSNIVKDRKKVQWTLEGISVGFETEPLSFFHFHLTSSINIVLPSGFKGKCLSSRSPLHAQLKFQAPRKTCSNQLLCNDWENPTLGELVGVPDGLWRLIELWVKRELGEGLRWWGKGTLSWSGTAVGFLLWLLQLADRAAVSANGFGGVAMETTPRPHLHLMLSSLKGGRGSNCGRKVLTCSVTCGAAYNMQWLPKCEMAITPHKWTFCHYFTFISQNFKKAPYKLTISTYKTLISGSSDIKILAKTDINR